VEVVDGAGKGVPNVAVWLIPVDQPGNVIGVVTDNDGKAWFRCRSGPGPYTAYVTIAGKDYHASVTPAVVGEWMQVKTVRAPLPE